MSEKNNAMAPDPLLVSPYTRLLKSRIVWLRDGVNKDTAMEVVANLMLLSANDPESDIKLFINSPGGEISAGMAVYDTMQLIPNDVVTVGVGMAASMGQFLLTAGAEGKRFATPNLRVLLHQPLGGYSGTSDDIDTQADLILSMKEQLASITASRTGKTVEQIHADGDRDAWFTAPEALEYGFVDHVLTSYSDISLLSQKAGK